MKNDDYWDKSAVKTKEIDFQVVQDPKTSFNLYKQGKIVQASIGDPDLFKANKIIKMSYLWMKQQQLTFNIINLGK